MLEKGFLHQHLHLKGVSIGMLVTKKSHVFLERNLYSISGDKPETKKAVNSREAGRGAKKEERWK